MRRHLNRLGLSLLLTVGVVAWNQQQTHSFSQAAQQSSQLFSTTQTTPKAAPNLNWWSSLEEMFQREQH